MAQGLESLTLDQLIWSMVMKLNRIHDSGGVSLPMRSARSMLLQTALDYGRHHRMIEDVDIDCTSIDNAWKLTEEAQRRSPDRDQPVLPILLTPGQATDRQLVELAMGLMGQWYDKDQKSEEPVTCTEYNLAQEIVRLLSCSWSPVFRTDDWADKVNEIRVAWQDREYELSESAEWSRYLALRKF